MASPLSLWAAKPMDEVRLAVTQALRVLKEPAIKSKYEGKELDERLRKIIDPLFDFREMAKRSLGIHLDTLEGSYTQRAARICSHL
jgi:ABC-type transporter MlaC component